MGGIVVCGYSDVGYKCLKALKDLVGQQADVARTLDEIREHDEL